MITLLPLFLVSTFTLVSSVPLATQEPIIYEGARVRITWGEPADWLHGIVQTPASRQLSIIANDADADTRIVLDERTRLQIHRGRTSNVLPGAIIGGVLGGSVSAGFFSDAFGNEGSLFATSQAAVAGGIAGLAAGVIVSFFGLGEDVWEDVPIRNGRIVFPSLESPPDGMRNASVQARILWDRFTPTEAGFVSFFEEHKEDLASIEGVFVRTDGFGRFAIVRDSMFADYRYVIINLEPPTTLSQHDFGQIMGGLALHPQTEEYDLRYVDDVARGMSRAAIRGEALVIERRDGEVSHWERRAPAPAPAPVDGDEAEPSGSSASNSSVIQRLSKR